MFHCFVGKMAFSLLLALLVLMATGGGRGHGRGRRGATKRARMEEGTSGSNSEYPKSSFEKKKETEERIDKKKKEKHMRSHGKRKVLVLHHDEAQVVRLSVSKDHVNVKADLNMQRRDNHNCNRLLLVVHAWWRIM